MSTYPPKFGLRIARAAFGITAGAIAYVDRSRQPIIGDVVAFDRGRHLVLCRILDGDAHVAILREASGSQHRADPRHIVGVVVGWSTSVGFCAVEEGAA
jgi:hypothetical protein